MPSSAAESRMVASPPVENSAGACTPKTTPTTTSTTSAGRLGRASARTSSRWLRDGPTGAPSVGRRSAITGTPDGGAGTRSGHRTTAAGTSSAGGRPLSVHDAPGARQGPGTTCWRATLRGPAPGPRDVGGGVSLSSGLQPPADAVVGVPGPAVDGPGVGHSVPDDARRVGGDLDRPAAGLPGGPQRLGHDGDADGVHRAPVRADVDPGDLAVGHLDVVVVGLQAEPPAQRPAPLTG